MSYYSTTSALLYRSLPSCPQDLFLTGFVDFSQVSWYRRQKKLHETDRLLFQTKGSRQTLYIRKVNPTDFGNYSCRAENALGEARTFTELSGLFFQKDSRPQTSFIIAIFNFTGRPRPPRFTSDAIGHRPHSYNITWSTDSFEPITEYKLLFRRSDVSWIRDVVTLLFRKRWMLFMDEWLGNEPNLRGKFRSLWAKKDVFSPKKSLILKSTNTLQKAF